jgi:hypothetical protein
VPPLYPPTANGAAGVAVFLPYDQLQLPVGQHILHVRPALFDSAGRQRAAAPPYIWSWHQPASYITRVDVNPQAYSGRRGGNGVSIKADFYCDLSPQGGGPALLTAHFINPADRAPIQAPWGQGDYTDAYGKLAISEPLSVPPGRQVYRGVELFLPDSAIPAPNSRDLDADLNLYATTSQHFLLNPPLHVTLRKSGR